MFEFIGFFGFFGLIIVGFILYTKALKRSDSSVGINNENVSTLKTLNDFNSELIQIAHRRARVEAINDVAFRVRELKAIDDELIRVSKNIQKTKLVSCG